MYFFSLIISSVLYRQDLRFPLCLDVCRSAVGYQPTLATEMGELQERIASTKEGSVTSVQAVYVPADDLTDPAPAPTFALKFFIFLKDLLYSTCNLVMFLTNNICLQDTGSRLKRIYGRINTLLNDLTGTGR